MLGDRAPLVRFARKGHAMSEAVSRARRASSIVRFGFEALARVFLFALLYALAALAATLILAVVTRFVSLLYHFIPAVFIDTYLIVLIGGAVVMSVEVGMLVAVCSLFTRRTMALATVSVAASLGMVAYYQWAGCALLISGHPFAYVGALLVGLLGIAGARMSGLIGRDHRLIQDVTRRGGEPRDLVT
jgi:hypothetical protein